MPGPTLPLKGHATGPFSQWHCHMAPMTNPTVQTLAHLEFDSYVMWDNIWNHSDAQLRTWAHCSPSRVISVLAH